MGFLPVYFQISYFPSPAVLDLGSGTEQTDRRTDNGHQCFMHPPDGAGTQ